MHAAAPAACRYGSPQNVNGRDAENGDRSIRPTALQIKSHVRVGPPRGVPRGANGSGLYREMTIRPRVLKTLTEHGLYGMPPIGMISSDMTRDVGCHAYR